MHPRIEDEAFARDFKAVAVRADFRGAGEVRKSGQRVESCELRVLRAVPA
jgi:hypothetical protein